MTCAPYGDTHTREQLTDAERFGQEIICAGIQRCNLVTLIRARGKNDHGHLAPCAQFAHKINTITIRKTKIENDDIRFARARP
jgi:hypothetical protein